MGSWFSKLWEMFQTKEMDVLCVGLSGSGKTTLTKSMKCERCDHTSPTMSLNIEIFSYQGVKIKVWDCGGQEVFRNSWETYLKRTKCNCMLFVIDSHIYAQKASHRKTVKRELHRMLKICGGMKEPIPVLVISNKIDLPNHASTKMIEQTLRLQTTFPQMKILLTEISATKGIGISGVLSWLIKTTSL